MPFDPTTLFDANCRIDGIWPIPNASPPDAMLEAVSLMERLPGPLDALALRFGDEFRDLLIEGDERTAWEEFLGELTFQGITGFIVQASVPVFSRYGTGKTVSYSWDYINHDLFFGTTLEEATGAAIAWASAKREAVENEPAT